MPKVFPNPFFVRIFCLSSLFSLLCSALFSQSAYAEYDPNAYGQQQQQQQQQPQQGYSQDPYGAYGQNPYGNYGQPGYPQDPYANPQGAGQAQDPYAGTNQQAPQDPYGAYAQDPYGQQAAPPDPYGQAEPEPARDAAGISEEGGEKKPEDKLVGTVLTVRHVDELQTKLTIGGKNIPITMLAPLDYTRRNLQTRTMKVLRDNFKKFVPKNEVVQATDYRIKSLTLEEFRVAAIRNKSQMVAVAILKATDFEMFLYDTRNPYGIYTFSEVLPDNRFHNYEQEILERHVGKMVENTLKLYIENKFYELPRLERERVLKADVPDRIATTANLLMANREVTSRFFLSPAIGSIFSKGLDGGVWNSHVISLQGGYRVLDKIYAEASLDVFSYNSVSLGARYVIDSPDSPFNFGLGLGFGFATAYRSLVWDQTNALGYRSFYVIPSFSLMLFPIGHFYLKCELRFYIDLQFKRFLVSALPGILFRF